MSAPAVEEQVELRIDRLAAGGDGVARLEGLVVFVPLTAPGDRVRARVVSRGRRFAHARLLEVLEPGPARRPAACPYYARCGGCSWMHLDESAQRTARAEIVREALRRIAGLDPPPDVEQLPSPSALGYRARARVAFADGRVGFRARGSHEIVDVERCAVLDARAQSELESLRRERPPGKGERELRSARGSIEVGPHRFRVSPGVFLQANRSLWASWLELVAGACGTGAFAVELYAGFGFFTAALAERFRRVIAVERGRAADDARLNAPVEVVRAAAEDWASRELPVLRPELVLLNPPRPGCHRSVLEAIRAAAPERVVYLSCDPATLARDVRELTPLRVTRVVAIDAFPQTHHVEVMCVLRR